VATWFTFLPSFIFILAGSPLVESTHGRLQLTGPLTAITAAVVGVVLNLTLFLTYRVLWPQGLNVSAWWQGLDYAALCLSVAAALALLQFKRSVMQVILVSAGLGWLWSLVGWL
jgi:chromate transporter